MSRNRTPESSLDTLTDSRLGVKQRKSRFSRANCVLRDNGRTYKGAHISADQTGGRGEESGGDIYIKKPRKLVCMVHKIWKNCKNTTQPRSFSFPLIFQEFPQRPRERTKRKHGTRAIVLWSQISRLPRCDSTIHPPTPPFPTWFDFPEYVQVSFLITSPRLGGKRIVSAAVGPSQVTSVVVPSRNLSLSLSLFCCLAALVFLNKV